jgi:predicted RecB family nuclease
MIFDAPLLTDFQFSQSSLQDYVDCPRRFQLRYMQRLAWPAPEAEPLVEHERHMEQGARFHGLVQRHIAGIPADVLSTLAQTEPLKHWWEAYLRTGLDGVPPQRRSEMTLTAPLAGFRLLAKYDLVAVEPGQRALIVDWKTTHKPSRERLATRLQTVVYRYLLAVGGAFLNGDRPIPPEQIEMVYWFAEQPDEPERFRYDVAQFAADEALLTDVIHEIAARKTFDLTADKQRCKFCTYRSLCDRGVQAGDFREVELDDEPDEAVSAGFDFDQIAEIEF